MKYTQIISAIGTTTLLTGCPVTSCFVSGTRISVNGGFCPIEQVSIGDLVWSWDFVRSQAVLRQVAHLIRGESMEMYRIEAGEFVISGVTGNHPIWSPSRGEWMDAAALRKDDTLLARPGSADAAEVPITGIDVRRLEHPVAVFTLTLNGPEHNYFAEGVLVHNKLIPTHDSGPRTEGNCLRVVGMSDGELHQFPDTALGDRVRHEVMITADTENCIIPYIEDTLSLSEDDPDDAFSVEEPFDAIPFRDLFDASVSMTFVFEPPSDGDFEAQYHLGFSAQVNQEVNGDLLLNIFGSTLEDEER